MSNLEKANPAVFLTLGGRKRRLEFTYWARALIEEERGADFLSEKNLKNITPGKTIILAWAGLSAHDPSLEGDTKEERRRGQRIVAGWLQEYRDQDAILSAITQAILNAAAEITKKKSDQDGDQKANSNPSSEPSETQTG